MKTRINPAAFLLALVMTILLSGCSSKEKAKNALELTFQENPSFGTLKGQSCMDYDKDGDGYVTCTASVEKDGKVEQQSWKCPAIGLFTGDTCKQAIITVGGQ
jgi:uncharacterized lipoprotein YehR (DUF1307 family)